ncbi:hypothetical protein SAMN02745227_02163 [Anaerobranca californiensis DSM 14826]|jgi:hypothetical protein|uniref:DUF8042 domain-containing protein n=1 Tax=Anaerobranca californiensis DSM 14826 TaxID=1120989 RepID=A0A1M6S3F0_9FIRM|nr:hypothetical protein [Anaerobranca californiensis]SHK39210.1 hypothetical protein SAMN02745227_02163 [Anaerobranca californiensis DSM 14826]
MNLDNYIEVFHLTYDLSNTIDEAFVEMVELLESNSSLKFENIIRDILEAINVIEESLDLVLYELPLHQFEEHTIDFKNILAHLNIQIAFDGDTNQFKEQINSEIYPIYLKWKKELDKIILPFIIQ